MWRFSIAIRWKNANSRGALGVKECQTHISASSSQEKKSYEGRNRIESLRSPSMVHSDTYEEATVPAPSRKVPSSHPPSGHQTGPVAHGTPQSSYREPTCPVRTSQCIILRRRRAYITTLALFAFSAVRRNVSQQKTRRIKERRIPLLVLGVHADRLREVCRAREYTSWSKSCARRTHQCKGPCPVCGRRA